MKTFILVRKGKTNGRWMIAKILDASNWESFLEQCQGFMAQLTEYYQPETEVQIYCPDDKESRELILAPIEPQPPLAWQFKDES